MFICECVNCKYNLSNFFNKIDYCGEKCYIIFPCHKDIEGKFSYEDYDLMFMAQQLLDNINFTEQQLYYIARDPLSAFNYMNSIALHSDYVLKYFCPESFDFKYTTKDGIPTTETHHKKFNLPYIVIHSKNVGYRMGEFIYVSNLKAFVRKNDTPKGNDAFANFPEFIKASNYDISNIWILDPCWNDSSITSKMLLVGGKKRCKMK